MANENKFIVKVQASIVSSDVQSILIYDFDENISAEFEATDDILKLLDGRPKAFFYAHLDKEGGIVLDGIAPWQTW